MGLHEATCTSMKNVCGYKILEWYCWIFLMNVHVNVALVLNYVSRKKPLAAGAGLKFWFEVSYEK